MGFHRQVRCLASPSSVFLLTLSNVGGLDYRALMNIALGKIHEGSQDSSPHVVGAR